MTDLRHLRPTSAPPPPGGKVLDPSSTSPHHLVGGGGGPRSGWRPAEADLSLPARAEVEVCADCGTTACGTSSGAIYLAMTPGPDGVPWWLCSICWRDQ